MEPHQPQPLLPSAELDRLRAGLADFTADGVLERLGLTGRSALDRGDLRGAARALPEPGVDRTADLTAIFLLGAERDEDAAAVALAPLSLDVAVEAGLVERSAGAVRAALEIRPYSEAGAPVPGQPASTQPASTALDRTPPWWVVSDLGSDVRPGPLPHDHVLGVGAASLQLAQATPRDRVRSALDIGTGCGVQALHLGRHSAAVTATDVSSKALRYAATTAALSGQQWDLRAGSLLEPVAGERYDLVVANPPFVVSAGDGGYDYRDSGLAGDAVCETLLRGLPTMLTRDGTAVVLANWIIGADQEWSERVGGWLAGRGCDVWGWQREVAEPGEYVSMWLRDTGYLPGTQEWAGRYDAWRAWFDDHGVAAVGMGLVALWATDADQPTIVFEDVPQVLEQPVGSQLPAWIGRQRWLRGRSDAHLLAARLRPDADLVHTRDELLGPSGWAPAAARLRQSHGLRWEVEVDDAIASVVAGAASGAPLSMSVELLAATLDLETGAVAAAVLPVVRDLISRGILRPEPGHSGA